MTKRLSIAVCLTLGLGFVLGVGCTSIPDSRHTIGVDLGADAASGGTGGKGGTGGRSSGGTGGRSSGGAGNGGFGTGGDTMGVGGGVIGSEAGVAEGGTVGPSITCGSSNCSGRAVGTVTFTPCCAGAAQNKCGLQTVALDIIVCAETNQPGSFDSNCPDEYPGGDTSRIPLKGCCRPDTGICGLVLAPQGGPNFGCVDSSELGVTAASSCTPPRCTAAGATCTKDADCCSGAAGRGACITFSSGAVCTDYCTTNADCASGCCALLKTGQGVCAPDTTWCGSQCRAQGESCDTDADCCSGTVCAPNGTAGPRVCSTPCGSDADCKNERCIQDDSGRGTCGNPGTSLCTDTCKTANDGYCDEGGYLGCTFGTDCTDCKPHLGGYQLCTDDCATAKDGVCDDGGQGTKIKPTCYYGSDCTDCGPRLGICSNTCQWHDDGYCDDGGPNSTGAYCDIGTDCNDCGGRLAGRGQLPCDGAKGNACIPGGDSGQYYLSNSTCECDDCAWDTGPLDCGATAPVASKCDGKSISFCCAPNNPCNYDGDGMCDCGGWCAWEKKDCGIGAFAPKCDGYSISSTCVFKPVPSGEPDGTCTCYGACSWEASDCALDYPTTCKDTCATAGNTICEDGGPGSVLPAKCTLGTDCADCGPRK